MTRSVHRYFSRALEGPIEATLELKDSLSEFLPKLIWTHILMLLALVLFWIIFLIENIFLIAEVYLLYTSRIIPWDLELWVFFGMKGLFLLFFTISLALILFLGQALRFVGAISGKYRIIESVSEIELNGAETTAEVKELARFSGDPIKAIMELLDDVNTNVPQLIRMYKVSIFLLACLPVFIGFSLFYTLLYGNLLGFATPSLLGVPGVINVVLKFIFIILGIAGVVFSFRARDYFLFFQRRRAVINDVRFEPDLDVPKGRNEVERFFTYLKATEPWLKKSKHIGSLERGARGFDGLFKAKVARRSSVYSRGGTDAAVFIKVYNRRIDIDIVKNYAVSVEEYVRTNKVYPLRMAIILKGPASSLDDDVYNYVLENPAFDLGLEEHYVQLVSEEDGVYSFIPNIGSPP